MGCYGSKHPTPKPARSRVGGILALQDSKLKTFPDEVNELGSSIRTLDLTRNRFADILTEIGKLVNMQRLILANNHIDRLPVNLGKLQPLKFLSFDGNRLSTLPDECKIYCDC